MGERTFPVGPLDTTRQVDEINRLLGHAVQAGAAIVVLPELAVTEEIAVQLQEWVRRPGGPRVLVAGSYHHEDQHGAQDSPTRRRNTAIGWVRGHDLPLVHDKHSPGDHPILEDIRPDGWPELRVYVTRDGWHVVMAICRDLLNPRAVHALSEAGANLLLVPAMSETLMTFGGPTSQLVGVNQALVAIANNPAEWPAGNGAVERPARALFGHPGLDRQTRAVTSQQPDPGIAVLTVGNAQITWHALPAPGSACGNGEEPQRDSARPGWIYRLAALWCAPPRKPSAAGGRVMLRESAVLVLLTGGPEGPAVLLSQRAADLTDYPDQWVFPGGSLDAGDADLVTTALREAREEVGLESDSVDVVGALPPRVLLDTGFLVTPILAWSHLPRFDLPPNASEVQGMRHVPLGQLLAADGGGDLDLARLSLGRMTRSVLEQLCTPSAVTLPR